MKYIWSNNASRQLLNHILIDSFNTKWYGILFCTEVTQQNNAHVVLIYDPLSAPEDAAATAYRKSYDANHHIRLGGNDAEIIYHSCISGYSYQDKMEVCAHEAGHMWGIADLYNVNKSLPSIYSQPYTYDVATRHERNAIRICLNNLWYNPGTGGVWKYQQTPGVFWLRGDVDMDNSITAADSRLALQYSAQMSTLSDIQIKLADVDNNGSINASDARFILQYSSQIISRFPADVDEYYNLRA